MNFPVQLSLAELTVELALKGRMDHLSIGEHAPDFALPDHNGEEIRLSELTKSQNVLLIFNIGFA